MTGQDDSRVERVVVETTDRDTIVHCRALIKSKEGFGLMIGRVVDGNGGYNIDPVSGRAWSWRLAGPVLAEVVEETDQAWPSEVEGELAYYRDVNKYAAFDVTAVEAELPATAAQ